MARVVIRTEVFGDDPDRLPRICVLTGDPADQTIRFRLKSTPTWTYLLLFLGVIPFLVVQLFTEKVVVTRLPVQRAALDRLLRLRRTSGWLAFVGLAGVGLAFVGDSGLVMTVGVLVGLAGLVGWGVANVRLPSGRQLDARHVEVSSVHADFVAAVHRVTSVA